jgi:glycerol-3-phosphate acyltransferase PlsY
MARDNGPVEQRGRGSPMDLALQLVLGAVIGYLFGMIPTGALVARRFGIDLTRVGSGSTGATNVLRTLGKRWAAVVFLGDLLKGTVAVLVAGWLLGGQPWGPASWAQVMAATFAVVGHSFSPLIGFRGGKGVVTGGGGLLIISPLGFLAAAVMGFGSIAVTRYASVGSILASIAAGVVVLWQGLSGEHPGPFLFYGLVVPGFVFWTHRGNIQRLLTGTERKLSSGRAPS